MDDRAATPAQPDAPADPGRAAAPARETGRPLADSYWLSSLELLGGVDVEVVGVRAVPTEALREFLRMREAWRQTVRLPPRARAAGDAASLRDAEDTPPTPSAFDLDITLEADGRVTLPGDLLPADG